MVNEYVFVLMLACATPTELSPHSESVLDSYANQRSHVLTFMSEFHTTDSKLLEFTPCLVKHVEAPKEET